MKLDDYQGYWGVQDNTVYWADTLEELKLSPNLMQLDRAYADRLQEGKYCLIVCSTEPENKILFLDIEKKVNLPEEYTMLQFLLKSVVLGVAPKLVELLTEGISEAVEIGGKFISSTTYSEDSPTVLQRKPSDTTKLTQYMYDFITYAYEDWKTFNRLNPGNKKSMDELIEKINAYMGTSKGRTSLGRVWNGHINRDELPVGKAYFEYPRKAKELS